MLGESRQASYLPPKPAHNQGCAANAASTALRLLECNPESLLPDGHRARGGGGSSRPSAAKVARQRYEEALKAKLEGPGDLLDFGSEEPVASGGYEADLFGDSRSRETQLSEADRMWPGDVVLARSSPQKAFYRARVVRMYSSRGMSLADVEWLPEEDGGLASDFLGSSSENQRHGLQVGMEVKTIQVESPRPRPAPSTAAQEAAALPDLLDFSPEVAEPPLRSAPRGAPFASTVHAPVLLDFGGADVNETVFAEATRRPANAVPVPLPQSSEERFGFVSDLILEASDAKR